MSSQVQENYIEEDEIDLRELWQTIMKGKKVIAIIVIIVVSLTFVYALKLPNIYKSEAILIPVANSSGPSLGGLGGLAAMAGVSIGGGGSMTPDVAFNTLLNDYEFMKEFVIKNKIVEYYDAKNVDKNYVFALGYRGLYDFFKPSPDEKEDIDIDIDIDNKVFNVIKIIKASLSIASDKKTALITVLYMDPDRTYIPKIINAFLKDASAYLVTNNLRIINNKLTYFLKEMKNANSIELRTNLSSMISGILQDKVIMKSKVYYQCDVLTKPSVAYIKDKAKPKRGLILVVSFVTSIILGVFLVFFLEFIRKDEEVKAI